MNGIHLNGQYLVAADFEQRSSTVLQLLADLAETEQEAIIEFLEQWFDASTTTISAQTSGSTGPPKTISLQKSQMLASSALTAAFFEFKAGQRALLPLSARFIAGKMMLVRAIVSGLQLDVRPANEIFPAKNTDPAYYDFAVMVPAQLSRIIEHKKLDSFREILLGGADLPPLLMDQLKQVALPVYQGFGMTETVSHIALRKVNGSHFEQAYTTLDGVIIKTDERGCLLIRSAATAGEWLQTNDVITLLNDRQFIWRGRFDNMLNSGGIKVALEEIESAVAALIAAESELAWLKTATFAVSRMPDPRFGESAALWVSGSIPSENERVHSLRLLKEKLPLAWAPKAILSIAQLPLLDSGKLNRAALSGSLGPIEKL